MKEWTQFVDHLEAKLGKKTVDRWVRTLTIEKFDARNLYLKAADPFQIFWFEEHVRPLINHAFPKKIRCHLTPLKQKTPTFFQNPTSLFLPDALLPTFTFDSWIDTPATAFVTNTLKTSGIFNPLFLYGPAGSGKTHLLHAVAHHLNRPKTYLISVDHFMHHMVRAMRTAAMQTFRETIRSVDILLVDDLHLLAGRQATQEEFFHTFNALHMHGIPLIFTSQHPPQALKEIEERLISRFEWGLLLSLPTPSRAVKESLIDNFCTAHTLTLTENAYLFLLDTFPYLHVLKEALELLRYHARLRGLTTLDRTDIQSPLQALASYRITPETLLEHIALKADLPLPILLSKSQTPPLPLIRKVAMYLLREKCHLSYPKIARFFSKNHTTVLAAVREGEEKMKQGDQKWLNLLKNFTP